MGIRQTLNEKSGLTTTVTVVILVAALAFIALQISHRRGKTRVVGVAFYSVDDGQTWFLDSADHIAPYTHDGKTAYRVNVYKCGAKSFVSHLERFPDADRQKIEQMRSDHPTAPLGLILSMTGSGLEAKRPGDSQWVTSKSNSKEFAKVMGRPTCPDGGQPTEVRAVEEKDTEK